MRLRTAIPITLAAAAAGTLAYGALVERTRWTLRRFDVPVLAPEAEPLRVLHISDLHMLPGQRSKQQWVSSLAATDPDLVILTGDNLAGPAAVPAVLEALEPLLDYPGGFVFGSNDYYGPVLKNPLSYFSSSATPKLGQPLPWRQLRDALTGSGWTDLTHHRTTLTAGGRTVELAGVDDPHLRLDNYDAIACPVDPEADIHIGLVHSPEPRIVDRFARDGFDLVLTGHTHGGQICVPGYGALVTNCGLDRSFAKGLHRWSGETWLHVSAGLGTSPYFPVRIACAPEASVLTLIGAPEARHAATRADAAVAA
ncbi:MAG: metallophosphoesterase [Corynebacteriales bacterium]|nr:metallophosphoesterase [Mycobacteriales bacterium]